MSKKNLFSQKWEKDVRFFLKSIEELLKICDFKRENNQEFFKRIYDKHAKNFDHTQISAFLVYFFQFLENHQNNGYGKIKKIFEKIEGGDSSFTLLANYGIFLINRLETEKDNLALIEYRIALYKLLEYFLLLLKQVTK